MGDVSSYVFVQVLPMIYLHIREYLENNMFKKLGETFRRLQTYNTKYNIIYYTHYTLYDRYNSHDLKCLS